MHNFSRLRHHLKFAEITCELAYLFLIGVWELKFLTCFDLDENLCITTFWTPDQQTEVRFSKKNCVLISSNKIFKKFRVSKKVKILFERKTNAKIFWKSDFISGAQKWSHTNFHPNRNKLKIWFFMQINQLTSDFGEFQMVPQLAEILHVVSFDPSSQSQYVFPRKSQIWW